MTLSTRRRGRRRVPLPLQALLVGIDGTLFESNDLHARAWREVLAERGFRVPLSTIRPLIGRGGEDLAARATGGRLPRRDLGELADRHEKLFEATYASRVKRVPGARAFLRDCHRRGLRVVLVSSGKAEQVEGLIRRLGAKRWIRGATDADDVSRAKPAPDLFRAAVRKFDLPRETAVVGDTPYDVQAARAARLPSIAVLTGGFSRRSLAGADRLYPKVGDMLEDLVWALR